MDEFGDKLNAILNDPAALSRIGELAKSVMGGESSRDDGKEPEIDPGIVSRVMGLLKRNGVRSEERALLEAMNAGLPLVVTDLPGNRELALDADYPCGLTAGYGDAEGFAAAVERMMAGPELYARCSANALARIRRDFDIEKLAAKTLETYR